MREIKDKNVIINMFNDINELANYVEKTPRKAGRNDSSETEDVEFTKTKSLEEAIKLFKYGDQKLYNDIVIERKKANIDRQLGNVSNKMKYERRIYGCVPNVPAYLSGNPLNMINPEKTALSSKVVNILLNVCYPWRVKTADVEKSGVTYLNVLDILEKKGYRVNLYCGVATEQGSHYLYMFTKIKTDKEPLNLKKICFPVANASMLRRIYFKWAECCNSDFDGTTMGYGSYDSVSHMKKMADKYLKDNYMIWDFASNDGRVSMEDVIEKLKDNGIEIEM